MKYYISADVTFFKSVPYFYVSSDRPCILLTPVPLPPSVPLSSPEPISDAIASRSQSKCVDQPIPKPPQVFTRCLKVSAPPSVSI